MAVTSCAVDEDTTLINLRERGSADASSIGVVECTATLALNAPRNTRANSF